jgi:hypothetical protein
MIAANEARREMEEYLKGREKINKVLTHIDGVIRSSCRNGFGLAFIKENAFHNLSSDQIEVVINELKDLGYNVTPVYEEHTEIQLTGRVGYNIVW